MSGGDQFNAANRFVETMATALTPAPVLADKEADIILPPPSALNPIPRYVLNPS